MPKSKSDFNNWWPVLPSFSVKPSVTFFGLDKNKAHCFTLPSKVGRAIGEADYGISWAHATDEFFGPTAGTKIPIILSINGEFCGAQLRQIHQESRIIHQFEWKDEEFESTRLAFRTGMAGAYESVLEESEHDSIAVFHHLGGHTFLVRICKEGSELEDLEEDFRPSHR